MKTVNVGWQSLSVLTGLTVLTVTYKRKDGTIGKGGWKAHLMAWGRKEGVNVWKLGIIENVSTLN